MLILSSIGVIIFYDLIRSYDVFAPRMFARAFAGLLLGVIIYELVQKQKALNINSKLLDCLIIISLSIPITVTFSKSDFSAFWKY